MMKHFHAVSRAIAKKQSYYPLIIEAFLVKWNK